MLLKELTELRAPSGWEDAARLLIRKQAERLLCGRDGEIQSDSIGNLYVTRRGVDSKKPRVMLCAHMDEVGLIVRFATEDGLLKVDCVGGVDARAVISKRVLVGEKAVPGVVGLKAVHLMSKADRESAPSWEQISVDIGATTREEAEALCPLGSYATFECDYREFGDGMIKGKALDDRVGCAILLDLLEKSAYTGELIFAFTVQEEVGMRGAKVAAKRVMPDLAIILEGTAACDLGMTQSHQQVTTCGMGAALRFMDKRMIADWKLLECAKQAAKEKQIPVHMRKGVSGTTDASVIQLTGAGVPCLVISVPCRYIHSPLSVAKKSDIDAVRDLTEAVLLAQSSNTRS